MQGGMACPEQLPQWQAQGPGHPSKDDVALAGHLCAPSTTKGPGVHL